MSLDVFGTRTSRPCQTIVVRRPAWMNCVPLSVVVVVGGGVAVDEGLGVGKDDNAAVLQIRIRSLDGDDDNDDDGGIKKEDNARSPFRDGADANAKDAHDHHYGPAHPRETYDLRTIIPPRALLPGDCAAMGVRATAILESWRGTMEDILDDDGNGGSANGNESDKIGMMTTAGEDHLAATNGEDVRRDADNLHMPFPADDDRHTLILICGVRGVGKSTFLRYAMNRILYAPATRSGGGGARAGPGGGRGGGHSS
jgi:hypothetical protein